MSTYSPRPWNKGNKEVKEASIFLRENSSLWRQEMVKCYGTLTLSVIAAIL